MFLLAVSLTVTETSCRVVLSVKVEKGYMEVTDNFTISEAYCDKINLSFLLPVQHEPLHSLKKCS